jgi:hypothetical protein
MLAPVFERVLALNDFFLGVLGNFVGCQPKSVVKHDAALQAEVGACLRLGFLAHLAGGLGFDFPLQDRGFADDFRSLVHRDSREGGDLGGLTEIPTLDGFFDEFGPLQPVLATAGTQGRSIFRGKEFSAPFTFR